MGLRADPALEERELLVRWREHGDQEARRVLAERLLPLVRRLAARYAGRGESVDDLVQVGSVGLLKAIDRFDLDRDLRLSTYAVPTVLGEIKRHFRDRVWALRVPRDVQELNARINGVLDRLTVKLGRSPTVEEIAEATKSTPERVLDALQGGQAFAAVSLDEPVGENGAAPVEALGSEDEAFAGAEHRTLLDEGLQALTPREREIVRLRFYEGMTQREIAEVVGISQMHVSRLLRRALEDLRGRLS